MYKLFFMSVLILNGAVINSASLKPEPVAKDSAGVISAGAYVTSFKKDLSCGYDHCDSSCKKQLVYYCAALECVYGAGIHNLYGAFLHRKEAVKHMKKCSSLNYEIREKARQARMLREICDSKK